MTLNGVYIYYIISDAVQMENKVLKMTPEAIHTADYILFKDQLFDCINGQSIGEDKLLKTVIKEGSCHIEF